MASELKHIDEAKLESDLAYRVEYLMEFMSFGEDDISTVHAAAPAVAPLVDTLVDAVYDKLFEYDCTKRHFVPRQSGYEGDVPPDLASLTLDHEQIKFRKNHLANYLKKLVTAEYDAKMLSYLDMVGKIHTTKAGSDTIDVPLVQMNALMGFVSDALIKAIAGLGLDHDAEIQAIRSFSKLLWIQNDLISRHYV